jgi:hypothetical protein
MAGVWEKTIQLRFIKRWMTLTFDLWPWTSIWFFLLWWGINMQIWWSWVKGPKAKGVPTIFFQWSIALRNAALRRKSKDWLAWNQNNVSEWSNMSTRGLLFQWTRTIKIQLSVLVLTVIFYDLYCPPWELRH